MSVAQVLGALILFNLIYSLLSTPAGVLSDKVGRKRVIVAGWLIYALAYAGFALARSATHVWMLFALYAIYYGLAYGTARALVADLVEPALRGSAYGTYNAVIGLLDLPASIIAGLLWQGAGSWAGWGASAPFWFGAALALIAAVGMAVWTPQRATAQGT